MRYIVIFLIICMFVGTDRVIAVMRDGVNRAKTAHNEVATNGRSAIDGDTFSEDGKHYQLAQIDAPELATECIGIRARRYLQAALTRGANYKYESGWPHNLVYLYDDHNHNLNVAMIRNGLAVPYYYNNMRGKYAPALDTALSYARAHKLGMWGHCYYVHYSPQTGVSSGPLRS